MADKKLKVALILSAVDNMTRKVQEAARRSSRSLEEVEKRYDRISQRSMSFARNAAGLGAAAFAVLAGPTMAATNFESQMANISTLVDTTVESMEDMGRNVLDISRRMPVAISDLTSSLYDIRSAGIAAADQFVTLDAAARLGVAGLGTSTEATNILTSSINAFRTEGKSAEELANILFKTVRAGKTTVSQLAQSFGATAPIVQAAGVQFADFQAATAAITSSGTPASQAQQQIRQAVVGLMRPTAELTQIFKELGVESGRELLDRAGNMGNAFAAVTKTASAMGININKAMGSVEGLSAVISLTGATNDSYLASLASMMQGIDDLNPAYEKQIATVKANLQIMQNQGMATAISFGNILLPELVKVLTAVNGMAARVGNLAERYPRLSSAVMLGVAAFGSLMFVISGLGFVFGGITKAISVFATIMKLATLATAKFNIALLANPIGLTVAAVVAGAYLIYRYWEPISAFFVGIWTRIKEAFSVGFVQGVIEVFKTFHPLAWVAKGMNALIEYLFGINLGDAGMNIITSLWDGMKSRATQMIDWFKVNVAQRIRNFLPFSPAKEGPLRDIHRIRLVETITESMKPRPVVAAMRRVASAAAVSLPLIAAPLSAAASSPSIGSSGSAGGGISVVYSPTITFASPLTPAQQSEFTAELRKHKEEIVRIIREENDRRRTISF